MEDLFLRLADLPLLQAAIVMACTFVTEDASILAAGILVGGGQMLFGTAFLGVAAGIVGGDIFLFLLGRTLGPRVRRWGIVSDERLERAHGFFDRHGVWVILAARCLPGSRAPTYLAAGVLRARPRVFLPTVLGAATAWAALALFGVSRLGEALLAHVHGVQWVLLGGVGLVVLVNLLALRRARRAPEPAPAE